MKKEIQLTKGELNEFVDFDNELVYIMESERQYVGSTYDDEEVTEIFYTDVKECYNYETELVVKLTEEQRKEIVKLANSYESKN